MTTWFIVPVADEPALREAYEAHVAHEILGELMPNASGELSFCGSSRVSEDEAAAVLADCPSAATTSVWPPEGGWDYPVVVPHPEDE